MPFLDNYTKILEFSIIVLLIFEVNDAYCVLPWNKDSYAHHVPLVVFFVLTSITISVLYRLILKRIRIEVPNTVFVLVTGAIIGTFKSRSYAMKKFCEIINVSGTSLSTCILPPLVFKTSFTIDAHTFLKSWLQVVLISTVGVLVCICCVGFPLGILLSPRFPPYKSVLFGILCAPIYPADVTKILKDIGYQTKHVMSLLEGESVVSLAVVVLLFRAVTVYLENTDMAVMWVLMIWGVVGGVGIAFIFGKATSIIVSRFYNNPVGLILWTLAVPYAAIILCERFLDLSGVICIAGIGLFMSLERLGLPPEVDYLLVNFWDLVANMVHPLVLFLVGVYIADSLQSRVEGPTFVAVIITYLLVMIGRFLSILSIQPILSRIGYGLTFHEFIVLVWGGVKGIFGTVLAFILDRESMGIFHDVVYIHIAGTIFFTLLLNVPTMNMLLKYIGITSLSLARQTNMNNCMKHISEKRGKAIVALKMDRFLSDANWPLIYSKTIMKHPYADKLVRTDEVEDIEACAYESICPECNAVVPNEPSLKDLRDMTREARLRTLKAAKISFMKQYEYGMLSKEGLRVLSTLIEITSDTQDAVIDLEYLYKLFKKQGTIGKFRGHVQKLMMTQTERKIYPPRKRYRRICYLIVTHNGFDIFMSLVILFNVIPIGLEMGLEPQSGTVLRYSLTATNTIFFNTYLAEFLLKIFGYSWIYICEHGFKTYFRSLWNVFDFVVLIAALIDLCFDYADIVIPTFTKAGSGASNFTLIAKVIRTVRFVRLFKLCQAWYPNIIHYCDCKIDGYKAFAYEVGKGFVNASEEVLEVLPQMVGNVNIRMGIKQRLETDKLAITRELGLIQKERPWIAITVKSKQAMRSTLNSMKDSITELKTAGWLDDYEYTMLQEAVHESLKIVKTIKTIPPNSPEVIFKEVAWMAADSGGADYLYQNAQSKVLDTGAHLCVEGLPSDGIFIITTGLLKLTYTPKKEVIDNLVTTGSLPIIDCIMNKSFGRKIEDYLVSGNTMGELSTLTGRPYNCDITAETPSEVFFIPRDMILEMDHHDVDEVHGLVSRMWKSLCLRLALAILIDVPAYASISKDKIKMALERGFLPKLTNYKVFAVTEMIEDIILIEGIVFDGNTNQMYTAPCYINRTVQKLVLPRSSQYKLETSIEPKLMIIPVKDQDEYDLMDAEENASEMVEGIAVKTVQQTIQLRQSRVKKRRKNLQRRTKTMKSFSSRASRIATVVSPGSSKKEEMSNLDIIEEETEIQNIHTFGSVLSDISESSRPVFNLVGSDKEDETYDSSQHISYLHPNTQLMPVTGSDCETEKSSDKSRETEI